MYVYGFLSEINLLLFGIPHGKIHGPQVLAMFKCPLGIIALQYGRYAEDTQLCI